MNKVLRERLLWLAFAVAFLVISSVIGYMFNRLNTVAINQDKIVNTQEQMAKADESNRRQWQKISISENRLSGIEAKVDYLHKDVERLKGIHIK